MADVLVRAAEEGSQTELPEGGSVATLYDRSGVLVSVVLSPDAEIACAKPAFAANDSPEVTVTMDDLITDTAGCPHCDTIVAHTAQGLRVTLELPALPLYREALRRGASGEASAP
jgi:uncharacterized Zn-finger protein